MEKLKNHCWNGKIYDPNGVMLSNPDIWYPSLESWEEIQENMRNNNSLAGGYNNVDCTVTAEASSDPKDHKVACTITLSANDYDAVKAALPAQYFDELETRRELEIMHQVRQMPGYSMLDKVDNAIEHWSHERQSLVRTENNRYKLKYRY